MGNRSIDDIRSEIEEQMKFLKEPLFTSISTPNPDWYLNACLNVDWDIYAEGYKKAGDHLVQYVVDSNCDQDFLIYPVVFLYRQYLELRLKELLLVSSKLYDQEVNVPKDHDLLSLWRRVRPNIEKTFPDSQKEGYYERIEDRIKELCGVDLGSYAFRYPEDTKGRPTLAGIDRINLKWLKNVVQSISIVLDGSSIGMGEHLSVKYEMMSEYQDEMFGYS